MTSLLKSVFDSIREDLGTPATLLRLIDAAPALRVQLEEPERTIDANSVVSWDDWGTMGRSLWDRKGPGELLGWKPVGTEYMSIHAVLPALKNIGLCQTVPIWRCDIQDVVGMSSSKSVLTNFLTMDDMVETNSTEMIDQITIEKLRKNLAHREIRIIHSPGADHFAKHLWDGRVFLRNSGGSHHFAAARYIAAKLKEPVPLEGRLCIYSLSECAIAELRNEFEIFLVSDQDRLGMDFHEALKSFKVPYLWHFLPRPHVEIRAIFLPRNNSKSVKVAKILHEKDFFNLGTYLSEICIRQKN